jgi:tellurite resistance protein TerC
MRNQPADRFSLVRKVAVTILGASILVAGIVMLVLPGPAFIFIPLGLAILATEFRWAKRWLTSLRRFARRRFGRSRDAFSGSASQSELRPRDRRCKRKPTCYP